MKAEEKARNNFYIAVPLLSPDPVEKNQPITIRKSTVIKKKDSICVSRSSRSNQETVSEIV